MRSIVRRAHAPLAAALCVTALSSAASADPAVHVAPSTSASARAKAALTVHTPHMPLVVDVEARARVALARVSPFAAARHASLVMTGTDRFGDGETIARFEQTHGGLPVIGRGAAVRLTSRGDELLTTTDLEEDLPSTLPSIPASVAASIASRFAVGTVTAADAHLVVWPLAGGGSRLAYAVLPQIPAGIPTSPRIIVDAQTGKVLQARDMLRFAKASVYEFNPIKSPAVATRDLDLLPSASAAGHLTNEFVTSSNCIDRKSVRDLNIQGFKAKVHVCDVEQLATANVDGDFMYTPSDTAGAIASRSDEFSEVSMYYHTAKAYAFFRTLQGNAEAQVVVDKPLRVIANLQVPAGIASGNFAVAADPNTPLDTFQNAFFSPAGGGLGAIFQQLYGFKGGGLWFGQGPQRDYAYDGDVVYHEFAHAVVDATLKLEAWHVDARGAIDSPGAMNEGLADYFSSAITGDPDVGEYASKDISQSQGVIRTLANEDKCPSAVIGEVHFDSTLFSGALWQARASLAQADRGKFDAALYKAMRTNPGRGDLGYDDLAKLFLATLGTDLPAGATALETAMTARGVLPSCERILEPKNGSVKAIEPLIAGFAAPGLQSIPDAGDVVPGIIQVHAKTAAAPADGKLVISFATKAMSSGGGANPLGGGGTPFTPVALVKFGKAITWKKTAGSASHDADKTASLSTGTRPTATVDIPVGTTDVFVQIGNIGDTDGAYDDITVDLAPATVDPPVTGDPPVTPPTDSPAQTESVTACGCSTPGHTSSLPLAGLFAGLALAGGVVRRRRR
jgi:MYXO-CTERM domain-containing protein